MSIYVGPSLPVCDPRSAAARYGITIELADLGDWAGATLISEYDPSGPRIRINERAIERYRVSCGVARKPDERSFIDFAIAHELYHHREAIARVERAATHRQREAAADAYARANVAVDAALDAFFKAS